MSEFPRALAALGLVASFMCATSVYAVEAGDGAQAADAETQHAVELVSAGVAAKPANDPTCPTVALAPSGDTSSSDGAKATLDALARDCANLGAETIVKVGVVGESVRKKKKEAAGFDAPMTIQVKDDQGRDVETRKVNLRVEMAEGVQKVSFQHVEENVSLPPPSANGYANWTIVVGLDPASPGDGASDEVASNEDQVDEQAAEKPRASRSSRYRHSSRSSRTRSARVKAVRYARTSRTRSGRQQITLQPSPEQAPVTVSAKPQPAPATITTTTANSGSPVNKVVASYNERRDRAIQDQQIAAAQQRAAAARQQQQGRAGQPRAPQQPAAQQAQGRPPVQTAQTN